MNNPDPIFAAAIRSAPSTTWVYTVARLSASGRPFAHSTAPTIANGGRRWHRRQMTSHEVGAASAGSAPGRPAEPKLLDRVREAVRLRHYSRRTEEAYVMWIRRFIVFHGKKHLSVMGGAEIRHT